VGKHHDSLSSKKVEHPIMDSLIAGPKLVNAISQIIRLWPPQFMSKFAQTVDTLDAFGLYLGRKRLKPFQKRHLNYLSARERIRRPSWPITLLVLIFENQIQDIISRG
jgi:hypothetical protein